MRRQLSLLQPHEGHGTLSDPLPIPEPSRKPRRRRRAKVEQLQLPCDPPRCPSSSA